MNWLNYSQAGKVALLGVVAVISVSSWTTRSEFKESRSGKFFNIVVILPFLLLTAILAFLRDFYGVAHDDTIVIEALFSTDTSEAGEFLLQNVIGITKHLAILAACLTFFGWIVFRNPQKNLSKQCSPEEFAAVSRYRLLLRRRRVILAAVSLGLFTLIHLNPTMCKSNPVLYFPLRYIKWANGIEATKQLQANIDNTDSDMDLATIRYAGNGPRTVVFVIGESTTRLNWSMYGYARTTTPELQALGPDLIKFDDIVSSDGTTVPSFQKFLTPATISDPDLWMKKPDILTMAKRAGYKTFWISNQGSQSGATGVLSIFASHADHAVFTNRGGSRAEGSLDEVILAPFQEALSDPTPRKFIVLHTLGAHPAYNFRYPKVFARFDNADDAVTKDLKLAGRAFWAIILRNNYDNAMLYTDHILKRILDLCKTVSDQPIAWIFVPDHGEDVAHYTNFVGHNTRVISQYEVPMLFWRSSSFKMVKTDLDNVRHRPYQLDLLDHTLLGLLSIEGNYYNPSQDIFSPDFRESPRKVAGIPYRNERFMPAQNDRAAIAETLIK